jgi:hypothetical protein
MGIALMIHPVHHAARDGRTADAGSIACAGCSTTGFMFDSFAASARVSRSGSIRASVAHEKGETSLAPAKASSDGKVYFFVISIFIM